MIDRTALERIEEVGGGRLLGKMIDLFLTSAPQRMEAARQALLKGELGGVEQAVHSLKSSAGNMGATQLQELAERIEGLAERGEGEEVPVLLDELDEILRQVLEALVSEKKGLEE